MKAMKRCDCPRIEGRHDEDCPLSAEKESGALSWTFSWIACAICSDIWVAVYPTCAPVLECEKCGYLNQKPPDGCEEQGIGWES